MLEKILTHLEVERIIEKRDSAYVLLKTDTQPDYARWESVTQMRYAELRHMQAYTREAGCLMHFIAAALDDPQPPQRCGRCKNCTGVSSKFQPDNQAIVRAQQFLRQGKPLTFEPRRRWSAGLPGIAKTTDMRVNQPGLALCVYFDDGYGALVRADRGRGLRYDEALVEASALALRAHLRSLSTPPRLIVPVPSLRRPQLVTEFAERLAQKVGLPVVQALEHTAQHPPQTEMRNSYQQALNVLERFAVVKRLQGETILLVDDIADSRWTLTVLGDLLQRSGAGAVHPFVIAVTNTSD
ncbi:MAG: RecQ family zinc-binding domain-containing protein [Chloroflexi bacterium]|uniref:ComF family protein n=1 Tax=Candidatus Flexifilum breve TaxID=3140694 RepID=UPI0031357E10|nr:RecQ family zinc-binding domain-containing protein [Chloroflexota bacterium]